MIAEEQVKLVALTLFSVAPTDRALRGWCPYSPTTEEGVDLMVTGYLAVGGIIT